MAEHEATGSVSVGPLARILRSSVRVRGAAETASAPPLAGSLLL